MAKKSQTSTTTATEHTFATGAKRSVIMPRYDLLPQTFLKRTSARFEMGLKYGENNYKRGLPFDDTFNHIIDHLYAYKERRKEILIRIEQGESLSLAGEMKRLETDGDDLAGAAWGLAAIMYLEQIGKLS